MKKALDELWESSIMERCPMWSDDEHNAIDEKDAEFEELRRVLTKEQEDIFVRFEANMSRLGAIYEKKAFQRGFTLAVRILSESLFEDY